VDSTELHVSLVLGWSCVVLSRLAPFWSWWPRSELQTCFLVPFLGLACLSMSREETCGFLFKVSVTIVSSAASSFHPEISPIDPTLQPMHCHHPFKQDTTCKLNLEKIMFTFLQVLLLNSSRYNRVSFQRRTTVTTTCGPFEKG
jgi:hypothetical protein